jgi:predicted dehydrogenase
MSSDATSRRDFLKTSAAVTAPVAGSAAAPADRRLRLGAIGTGGRGQYLMKELNKTGQVDWVAVCDVYNVRRDQAATIAGTRVTQFNDHRQLLDIKDIDAVIIATPDHWHPQIAIDAMNAGKDVYVEKPIFHRPEDGMAMVKAARATKRIFVAGTQGRTLPQFQHLKKQYVDSGILGKVGVAKCWYTSNSGYMDRPIPAGFDKAPDGLDWKRWLGPGPKVNWTPEIYFSPYRWYHYDGGPIMGIAIHVIDSAHHLLDLTKPAAAVAGGGIYYFKDGRDTPDTVSLIIEYPQDVMVTFLAESLTCPDVKTTAGVELRGTGGVAMAERYVVDTAWRYTPNKRHTSAPAASGTGPGATAEFNVANWLECIRTRQTPVANIESVYYSTVACAMGQMAYRSGSKVYWNDAWNLPA